MHSVNLRIQSFLYSDLFCLVTQGADCFIQQDNRAAAGDWAAKTIAQTRVEQQQNTSHSQ